MGMTRPLVALACLAAVLAVGPVVGAHDRALAAVPAPLRHRAVPTASPPQPAAAGRRTIALRRTRLDLYLDGRTVLTTPLDASRPIPLVRLATLIGNPAFLSRTGTVVTLRARLVQEAGTSLVIAAPTVTELRLVGAPGVMLGGTGATALISHVHVTSWSLTGAGPVTTPVDSRPSILYQRKSHLVIDSSRFSFLGGHTSPTQGVTWRLGAGGSATSSVFDHNGTGAVISAGVNVALHDDHFASNADDGLDVSGPTPGLSTGALTATDNGGTGVSLSHGVKAARLTGITADGNAEDGVALENGTTATTLIQVSAAHNRGNGLSVDQATGATVSGLTAEHDRVGIKVSGSTNVSIAHASLSSNPQGGLQADTTTGLAVQGLSVRGPGANGLVLSATGTTVSTSTISGVRDALRLTRSAALTGVTISHVQRGVIVTGSAHLTATGVSVRARRVGLDLDEHGAATVVDSSIHAPVPHRGGQVGGHGSTFSGTPFPYLIAFGLAILVVAIGLEVVRHRRSRGFTSTAAPPDVWNTTC